MSRSELNVSRWLEAHSDRSANLKTVHHNAILVDVTGDGYVRLVITDLKLDPNSRCRLKVYKGTLLTTDLPLQDVPSSVIGFYTDDIESRIPAVAVACGSNMLIFKNNKPFYKFTVPSTPVLPLELEAWQKLSEPNANIPLIVEELKSLKFNNLTPRSQNLLQLSPTKYEEFIERYSGTIPTKTPPITCMTTIKRSSPDKSAVACPVIGTETGIIYILDPQSYIILHQANTNNIKATPFIIDSIGLFDVEFRILVVCRERNICMIRRGWLEGKSIIQMTNDIIDLIIIPGDNFIVVATTDKTLHCYTKRGQRLWSAKMVNSITCLCLVSLQHLSTHLIAVGLKGGMVHLYQGRHPVDYTSVPDTPSVITFGQLGQEEHVMVIITIGGTLNFKILKRTADFNLQNHDSNANPALQSKPLPLPKRSKLFLEQSLREKQNAVDMHQNFQQDLIRLRLIAARAMVQSLSDQSGIGNEKEQIKLSAQVLGLGPKFTLILTLDNMNNEKPVTGLTVVFHAKPTVYVLSSYVKMIPLIPPSLSYKMEIKVEEKVDINEADQQLMNLTIGQVIRVFITRKQQTQPVLAATINMPATELQMI